jgi:hypothetical protein
MLDLKRVPDWDQRFVRMVRWSTGKPYVYGDHDCALFAADIALAVVGEDPAAEFRGQYATYQAGLRLLNEKTGCKSLEAWADTLWPRVGVASGRRADWALADVPVDAAGNTAAGLVVFDGTGNLIGPEGALLPLSAASLAWSVG